MRISIAVVAGLVLLPCSGRGEEPPTVEQMKQMLDVAQRRGQLEMDGGAPFHLVASYVAFDAQGNAAGKGKYDELWENPLQYRKSLTLPALAETKSADGTVHFAEDFGAAPRTVLEVDNGSSGWASGRWSLTADVRRGLDAAVKPLFLRQSIGDRLSYEKPPPNNPGLECVGTEADIPGVAPDTRLALTTYCMSKGSHLLRLVNLPSFTNIVFDDIQLFGEVHIARTIRILQFGKLRLQLHVDILEPASDFSALDAAPLEGARPLKLPRIDPPLLSGEAMQGRLLTKVSPMYPHGGLHGALVVKVHVDTTGSVDSAEIVSSENQILKMPVLAAVKQWKFRVSYQGTKLMPATWAGKTRSSKPHLVST